jgi:hypothetical protein
VADSLFVDGISEITVSNGVVRIEFFTLSVERNAAAKPGESPRMQVGHRMNVAMPLQGFATSLRSIDQFKQKLIDSGAMKKAAD